MFHSTLTKGRHAARNAVVAACSALTLAFLAIFAVAPATVSFAATTATSKISAQNIVFYGKVLDERGRAIKGARVVVYHFSHHRRYIDKVVNSDAKGTWRVERHTGSGRYYVAVQARIGGRFIETHKYFDAHRGHAYRLIAQLVRRGFFAFFPVTHY